MSDFSAFANRTIKVTRDDETRRGHLSLSQCTSAGEAFSAIEAAVAALFVISPIPIVGYRITYPDGDGDLCTLTQDTVSDFVENAPEGILRLTLTQTSSSGNGGNAEVNAFSSPMEMDAAASAASPSGGTSPDADDVLRAKLQGLSQKIPPGMRPFLLTMVQGMDPSSLHHLLGYAMARMAGITTGTMAMPASIKDDFIAALTAEYVDGVDEAVGVWLGTGASMTGIEREEQLAMLHVDIHALEQRVRRARNPSEEIAAISVELGVGGQQGAGVSPHAVEQNHESQEASKVLHTLCGMEPSAMHALVLEILRSGVDAEGSTPCGPDASNPLEAMLGAFLGGKGCGKGFGKGCGKGGYTSGSHPQNPLDVLGPLLAGKGFGKGGGMAGASMPNPLESFLSGLGQGTGCAQGAANDGHPPNPMQALFQTLLAGKGSGKGFVPETAGSVPSTPFRMATACDAASDDIDTARAAFEESVNDLLNMGLVTDRQTARELLTQHGDISSVVALLADSEP